MNNNHCATINIPVGAVKRCTGTELALLFLINKAGSLTKKELNEQVGLYSTTVTKGVKGLCNKGFVRVEGNRIYSLNQNDKCVLLNSAIAELYVAKLISETELRVTYAILVFEKQGLLITIKALSDFLNIDTSGISKAINSLSKKGLVKKEKNTSFTKNIITANKAEHIYRCN